MKRTEIKIVSWEGYCSSKDNFDALLDLDTVPLIIRGDYAVRNKNLAVFKALCTRCNGTGNEMFTHYRKCQHCHGTGVAHE